MLVNEDFTIARDEKISVDFVTGAIRADGTKEREKTVFTLSEYPASFLAAALGEGIQAMLRRHMTKAAQEAGKDYQWQTALGAFLSAAREGRTAAGGILGGVDALEAEYLDSRAAIYKHAADFPKTAAKRIPYIRGKELAAMGADAYEAAVKAFASAKAMEALKRALGGADIPEALLAMLGKRD